MKWVAEYLPLKKATKEDLEQMVVVPIDNKDRGMCAVCNSPAHDSCYNCEKKICKNHTIFYFFVHNTIILSVCEECEKDNENIFQNLK